MKIRIKNIFVNKQKNKKDVNENNVIKLKKVYDANDLENIQYKKFEQSNKRKREGSENKYLDRNIDTEEKEDELTNIKRRKGYVQEQKDDNFKLKLYYQNLVKNKNKLSRGYYILLFAMIALGAGSVLLASKTYNLFNQEDYQVFSSVDKEDTTETINNVDNTGKENEDKEELNLQSIETSNKDTIDEFKEENKENNEKKENVSKSTTNNSSKKNEVKVVPLSFSKPIEGEIIKVYSPDKVIYSKTLELWKVHDGIDIKADEGTYVKTIERGIVEKIYQDSFLGTTIVIDHGQGYKSSYSNLDNTTLVKAKQSVKKGEKIGKIGKTAIGEIKDESHLHFMLYKNNKSENPSSIFK